MTVETASRTDAGRDRSHNEDTVSIITVADTTLLVVADGMGGHRAGGVASEHAVNRFRTFLDEQLPGRVRPSTRPFSLTLSGPRTHRCALRPRLIRSLME